MTQTYEIVLPVPAAWTRQAACTPADHERLDPIVGARPTTTELAVRIDAARGLCARCPVTRICGAEADLHRDLGVRGGALRLIVAGSYLAVPLVPEGAPSVFDRQAVDRRIAAKRMLVQARLPALVR